MKNTLVFLLICFLLSLIGLSLGIYQYASDPQHPMTVAEVEMTIKNYFAPPTPTVVAPPEDVKPPEPVVQRPITSTPPVVINPPPQQRMTAEEANEIMLNAEESYKRLKFLEASNTLAPLLKANPAPEITTRAVEFNKKCLSFNDVIKSVLESEMTSLTGMVSVQYLNGQTIVVRLLEETATYIRVRRQVLEKTIPLREISGYTRLTSDKFLEILNADYEKQLSRLNKPTAKDYYKLAVDCYKNHLNPQALAMLEKVWETDKTLFQPQPVAVDPVIPTVTPTTPPAVTINNVDKQLAQADKYCKDGDVYLEKAMDDPGPKRTALAKKAADLFHSAISIYNAAKEVKPDDDNLDQKIDDIGQKLIYIRKQLGVSHE